MAEILPKIVLLGKSGSNVSGNIQEILRGITKGLPGMEVHFVDVAASGAASRVNLALEESQVVVIHNSATYRSGELKDLLAEVSKVKRPPKVVVIKQDEHVEPYAFDGLFSNNEVDLVLTCLKPELVRHVYPKSFSKGVRFKRTTTAYVPPQMRNLWSKPPSQLRVGYRGKPEPIELGHLGQQKNMLPTWARRAAGTSRPAWLFDVSSDLRDRLYGEAWIDFLRRSYALLGSESGTNAFDLDGSLKKRTRQFVQENGAFGWQDEQLAERYVAEVLVHYEGNVPYGTIAPRHLEAAVLGRPQILTHGIYEGIFVDEESAFFVDDDFVDLPVVLDRLSDPVEYRRMANTARESVLDRPELRLENFLSWLSREVEVLIQTDGLGLRPIVETAREGKGASSRHERAVAALFSAPVSVNPRYGWLMSSVREINPECKVVEFDDELLPRLGLGHSRSATYQKSRGSSRDDHVRIGCGTAAAVEITSRWISESWSSPGVPLLAALLQVASGKSSSPERRWARIFLRRFAALLSYWQGSAPDSCIAADLPMGFAASVLWGPQTRVMLDLQEPLEDRLRQASTNLSKESQTYKLWGDITQFTSARSSHTVASTDEVAEIFRARGLERVDVAPSVPPLSSMKENSASESTPVKFIHLSSPNEQSATEGLVRYWMVPQSRAELHVVVDGRPTSRLRELARNALLNGSCVVIHQNSAAGVNVPKLESFDVGVVGAKNTYPYHLCFPPIVGQYMASGLALLVGGLPAVEDAVSVDGSGVPYSWQDPESFVAGVELLTNRTLLESCKTRSSASFLSSRHWEVAALPMLKSFLDFKETGIPSAVGATAERDLDMSTRLHFQQRIREDGADLVLDSQRRLVSDAVSWVISIVGQDFVDRCYALTQDIHFLAKPARIFRRKVA